MADALDSESSARKGVEVQVLSRANFTQEVALDHEKQSKSLFLFTILRRDG